MSLPFLRVTRPHPVGKACGMMTCRKLGESSFSARFLATRSEGGRERSAASAEMQACSGSGGTLLVLESPCWFVVLLRSDIQKFLV